MDTQDKTVLQSYKLTTIRTGIGIYGQRLLLRIVEAVQNEIDGLSFKNGRDIRKVDVRTETNLFGEKEISMSLRSIMGNTNNITDELKAQIKALAKADFEYEDENEWRYSPFFSSARIAKGSMSLTVCMQPLVWEALMDYSKGFRKFSLDKAMSFKSAYSLRFYQLFSLQTEPITYSLDELKKMFGVEEKYKDNKKFIERTIDVAKEELDNCSPYTFTYEPISTPTGKAGRPSITAIRFKPKYQLKFDTEEAEYQNLVAKHPGAMAVLSTAREKRLMNTFGITHKGIRNNHKIFEAAVKYLDFDPLIDKIARRVSNKRPSNPAGYLVRALKDELIGEGIEI